MSQASPFQALVVDDDKLIQQAVTRALSREDFVCSSATDGQLALEKLRETTFDIVICDLRMPNVNGHELIVGMLKMDNCPAIMVLTGIPDPRIVRDLLLRGIDDIIVKPANLDVLVLKAKAIVQRRQLGDSPETKQDRQAYDATPSSISIAPKGTSADGESLRTPLNEVKLQTNPIDPLSELPPLNATQSSESVIASQTPVNGTCSTLFKQNGEVSSGLNGRAASADPTTSALCQRTKLQISQACHELKDPPQQYDGFLMASDDVIGLKELVAAIQQMPSIAGEALSLANRVLYQASEQLKNAEISTPTRVTPILETYRYIIGILLFLLGGFIGFSITLLF